MRTLVFELDNKMDVVCRKNRVEALVVRLFGKKHHVAFIRCNASQFRGKRNVLNRERLFQLKIEINKNMRRSEETTHEFKGGKSEFRTKASSVRSDLQVQLEAISGMTSIFNISNSLLIVENNSYFKKVNTKTQNQ